MATWRRVWSGCHGAPATSSGGAHGSVHFEVEAGAPLRAGFDLESLSHRPEQLAADREPGPRAGEMLALRRRRPPYGLIQRAEPRGVDAVPGVSHRELEAPRADGQRRDLHEARVGKLDGIGGQVEQHARQRALVSGAPLRYGMHQADLEALLLRDG